MKRTLKNEKLTSGMVGNAFSVAINARDAFDIEFDLIRDNNKYPLCDDPSCFDCRGTWLYNKRGMFLYYLKYFPFLVKKV